MVLVRSTLTKCTRCWGKKRVWRCTARGVAAYMNTRNVAMDRDPTLSKIPPPRLFERKVSLLRLTTLFLVTFLTSLNERRVIIIRRTRGNRPCFCATSDRSLDLVRFPRHKRNFKIMKNLLESPFLNFSKLSTNIEEIKIIKRSKSLTLSFSNYPRN